MEAATRTCPHCGFENRQGSRFCAGCAAPLAPICPACGTENLPGARFCDACATPLALAPAPAGSPAPAIPHVPGPRPPATFPSAQPSAPPPISPQEERRLVTALFCDLVGFTPLSESLDPEEVRDIQAAYFEAMSAQIERYGGTVEKYAGDAVLALFGVPIAHEDDAERAVLCALGMQRAIEPVAEQARARWQAEPQIRVGMNTGEVVSGTWNASGRQDVAVTGDAVNTAARIQAAAEPGEVLASEETMRLTRRRIRYGQKRELVLKGKLGTVPGYPALGLREEFGERWQEAPRVSPLVGRDREMVELFDAWVRAQGGEGQLLTLVGEPGVGKSRLMTEFLEKMAVSSSIRVFRARCLSYGQEISLWLIADLLRGLFGIQEQEGLDEIRAKLGSGVRWLLEASDRDTRDEALDVLGEVLGLPAGGSMVANAGPQIRRHALLRSLRLVLASLSSQVPTVVVLEDLHWIDVASTEVLKEVLSDVPGLRLLVVAAQRPGWTAPWSEWGWTERITLRPLKDEEATALAGAVLGGATLSADLQRYVAERAGGNPFFVEEMLRALEETGGLEQRNGQMTLISGAAERLPNSLTEVLLARLDRLEGQVKTVVQVGSVIGRSFAVRLLATVMDQEQGSLELPLLTLQQAEIAFPRHNPDLEYVFKHVSMREVAYNTLVHKRRQELHLQTARALVSLYPADEYAEMIAYHYSKTDAPEVAEWLERAGDRAAAIYAVESAIDHYQEAIGRLEQQTSQRLAVALLEEKLGQVLIIAGRYQEALAALEEAVEIYRQEQDLEAAGRATAQIGLALLRSGKSLEGVARVQPMVETLSRRGPSSALGSLYVELARLMFSLGRYREQVETAERGAAVARALGDDRLLVRAEERRGSGYTVMGQVEEGRKVFDSVIALAEATGDLRTLELVLGNMGEIHRWAGEIVEALRYNERSLEVAERIGELDQVAFSLMNVGQLLCTLGDWQSAREYLERAVEISQSMGPGTAVAAYPLEELGRLELAEGKWEEAARLLEDGMAIAEAAGDRQAIEYLSTYVAELEILQGRPKAGAEQLLSLVSREDALLSLLLPTLAWAELESGAVSQAAEHAQQAVLLARDQGQRLSLVDALWVQGMIFLRQERLVEAGTALQEALELARILPYPYSEGRILEQMAALCNRREDPGQARERTAEALTIFQQLGARKDVERTRRELTALDRSADPIR